MQTNPLPQMIDKSTTIPKRLAGESLHRYFSLMRDFYDTHGRCVITFDGHLDADRMARAVRLTLDADPILGCRLVEHPWRPYWERYDDLDHIPVFSVVLPRVFDGELEQFMGTSLNPAKDTQIQVCLFRTDHDTLCIKINHIIADAGGLLQYAGLLAEIYRQLDLNSTYVPPCFNTRRTQTDVLKRVGLPNLLRALRHFSLPPAPWGKPIPNQGSRGRKFLIRRVAPQQLAAIKAYAHQRKIPLNHILLAAYYRALFEAINPPMGVPLATQVTVSLRRYLDADPSSAISNLVGAFFPTVIRKPNDRFEDTLDQVHVAMQHGDAIQPWLGQLLMAELAFSPPYAILQWISRFVMTRKKGPPVFPPIYANLGVIDPNPFNFGNPPVVDIAMIGPAENPPTRTLTLSSFRETMVLTTSYHDVDKESMRAQCLLDQFIHALPI